MAGTLTISTLSDGTNSTSATNCIQGSAKAWLNYNGSGSSIRGSYNVSSVTVNGTGNYTVNFTTAMANANYAANVTCNFDNSAGLTDGAVGTQAAASCKILCHDIAGGTLYNPYAIYLSVFSS